jgi:raffinose/stachyose/melibiose transport system substrate-binding protein
MRFRPRASGLALLAVCSLTLAACSAGSLGSSSDSGGSGSVELTYLTTNQDQDVKEANQLAADFHAKNPNITIKVDTRPGGTEGDNIIKTRLSTGDMPEVFNYNTGSLFQAIAPQKNLVPISDQPYIGDLDDNFKKTVTADGQVYGVPVGGFMGGAVLYNIPIYQKLGLKVPKTWAEFMADAKKLKAAGLTPFGMGNKDGYGGAWFFSLIGKQNLNSIDELKAAMIGKAKFSDPKFSSFYQLLADMRKNGYLNSDVASISFTQGLQLFGQKKVAMSWVTDGNTAAAAKALGGVKGMGVGPIPVWGKGKLAHSYDTTQSSTAFITSWSKHPRAAAQFLVFLHSQQALKAWYKATGVFPADKRFPASLVTDPIAKQQLALDKSPVSVWPENYVPPQVDGNADLAAGEMITSGSGSPADAVALWDRELKKWKSQHPDEFRAYSKWVSGG